MDNFVKGWIDNFKKMTDEWKRHDEAAIQNLREEGLLDLNNGAWDDTYDILGYNPPCPSCGFQMRYNWGAGLLQCPNCGKLIFDGDFDYSDMPDRQDIDFDTFYNH